MNDSVILKRFEEEIYEGGKLRQHQIVILIKELINHFKEIDFFVKKTYIAIITNIFKNVNKHYDHNTIVR